MAIKLGRIKGKVDAKAGIPSIQDCREGAGDVRTLYQRRFHPAKLLTRCLVKEDDVVVLLAKGLVRSVPASRGQLAVGKTKVIQVGPVALVTNQQLRREPVVDVVAVLAASGSPTADDLDLVVGHFWLKIKSGTKAGIGGIINGREGLGNVGPGQPANNLPTKLTVLGGIIQDNHVLISSQLVGGVPATHVKLVAAKRNII